MPSSQNFQSVSSGGWHCLTTLLQYVQEKCEHEFRLNSSTKVSPKHTHPRLVKRLIGSVELILSTFLNAMWNSGWSLTIMMLITPRLATFAKRTSQRWGHLSFNFNHWMAGVSLLMSSNTCSCKHVLNVPLRLETESLTWLDCFCTSAPPVPMIVRFIGCPSSPSLFAAASVIYKLGQTGI